MFESWNFEVDLLNPPFELLGTQVLRLRFLAIKVPETFIHHLISVGRDANLLRVLSKQT